MKSSDALGQFTRFAAVGVAGFLVDVCVLYAVAGFAGWYAGRIISFLAAASSTWWLNRRFTFAGTNRDGAPSSTSALREYLKYLLTMLGGAAVNYLAYALTLKWVHLPMAPALGVALGSIAGLLVNFLLARHVVFSTDK